jgi:predicted NBD/HSP70 family sugar kinase
LTAALIEQGLLHEGQPRSDGRGRPRQPLEIDSARRHVVGLAFEPGSVSVCRVNLHGKRIGAIRERAVKDSHDMVSAAAALVRAACNSSTLLIGAGATGFVDPETRAILTSSSTLSHSPTLLEPVYRAAGDCQLLLENDMHARAFHWLMSRNAAPGEDVLLVDLRDGALGAALLIDGQPNRGCVIGGNELGHTRLPVETQLCYCGHAGCLERICSSDFLARQGEGAAMLYDRLSHFHPGDAALTTIASHLATGIGNAINFIRPNRVLLTGKVTEPLPFCNHLITKMRSLLLAPLADRVRIEIWEAPGLSASEAAAWVALASLYRGGRIESAGAHEANGNVNLKSETSGASPPKIKKLARSA